MRLKWRATLVWVPLFLLWGTIGEAQLNPAALSRVGLNLSLPLAANPGAPSVEITTVKRLHVVGDRLQVELTTRSGTDPSAVDFYLALLIPDGSIYFLFVDDKGQIGISPDVRPILPGWPVPDFQGMLFDIPVEYVAVSGTYTLIAAFTPSTDLTTILSISIAPFTLSGISDLVIESSFPGSPSAVLAPSCSPNDSRMPILLIHGYGYEGDEGGKIWNNFYLSLGKDSELAARFCLKVFNWSKWDSLEGTNFSLTYLIKVAMDKEGLSTRPIIVIAHSAGGVVARNYMRPSLPIYVRH